MIINTSMQNLWLKAENIIKSRVTHEASHRSVILFKILRCNVVWCLRGCTLMTSSETPPGGGTSKRWLLVTGGEGGSSQKVTSFINNRNIKGVHYKLLEMLYNYRKYQIITHFFILFGLKILRIVINNTVVANNSYFKFYISNFRV